MQQKFYTEQALGEMFSAKDFMFDCTDGIRLRIENEVEEMEPVNYLCWMGEGDKIFFDNINESDMDETLTKYEFNINNSEYVMWKTKTFDADACE